MEFFMARLSGSRVAYALGIGDERYGTPLQIQLQLLGQYTPEPIDGSDPSHPAVQGQALEAGILQLGALEWARKHGHPIELVHAAALAPRTAEDPAGGLRLEHPTEPLECHPDAYLLCHTCRTAWLADAKRYSSSLDAEAAKDELRAQLAFNAGISHACRDLLPIPAGYTLSSDAIGVVLKVDGIRKRDDDGQWFTRATFTPGCLEVPCPRHITDAVLGACSRWMRDFVLPWFEGITVPSPEPRTYLDVCLLWPEPTPDKILEDPTTDLMALITEHAALTDALGRTGADVHLPGKDPEWMATVDMEARQKELRTAILLRTADAEAIAPGPGLDVICTLKSDQYGKRHVRYAVKTYNDRRRAVLKRLAKKEKR